MRLQRHSAPSAARVEFGSLAFATWSNARCPRPPPALRRKQSERWCRAQGLCRSYARESRCGRRTGGTCQHTLRSCGAHLLTPGRTRLRRCVKHADRIPVVLPITNLAISEGEHSNVLLPVGASRLCSFALTFVFTNPDVRIGVSCAAIKRVSSKPKKSPNPANNCMIFGFPISCAGVVFSKHR
jgi:hypothetical protein